MTAAVARVATTGDHPWLAGYVDYCGRLDCSDRALRDRLRAARALLADHPDLEQWMRQPIEGRLADLRRTAAWPLVVFLIGTGRLRLDIDLAVSKNLTGLGGIVQAAHAADFARARDAGQRLGWTDGWVDTVLGECLAVVIAWHGAGVPSLSVDVVDAFDAELGGCVTVPRSTLKAYRCRMASLRQILFEIGVHDTPPRRRPWSRTLEQRFADVPMADGIRAVLLRYVQARAAVLRPKSVEAIVNDLLPFAEFLTHAHPDLTCLRDLRRDHIEEFLIWNRTRPWRGQRARQQPIGKAVAQSTVLTVRNLLEDIAAWGWHEAPGRRLVFAADVPKLDRPLPRALTPDVDARLMAAVDDLPDLFARTGLRLLRGCGLRVGELLDLQVDAVVDFGATGTWLQVPLGKLATERLVPMDRDTITALDAWSRHRGPHRPIPHPRTGRPTDFVFTERGRRLGATRLRNGLIDAATAAGLVDDHGTAIPVTPHQLRHTYATALANAGMSMQALMALLGHVTPEMTLRYATLASPTLRTAYDQAITTMRSQLSIAPVGRPIVPDKVAWLASEMIKTRVGNGYCSRHQAQGACSYANICETCENFTTGPEFAAALTNQLHDIRALQADAQHRGWTSETQRHEHVAVALEGHLSRLQPR